MLRAISFQASLLAFIRLETLLCIVLSPEIDKFLLTQGYGPVRNTKIVVTKVQVIFG